MSDNADRAPSMDAKCEVIDGYFYRRAEVELSCAQKASHPAAVKAHYMLAGYYLDRAYRAPADSFKDTLHLQG